MSELQLGIAGGELELRRSSDGRKRLRGRFPYNKRAVISDGGRGGRPVKETFASRAFAYRVEDPQAEVHLLVGHSYDKPLASRLNGTLALRDAADALTFEATISEEIQRTTYWADFYAGFASGLVAGISPGFRLPPTAAVPREQSERVEEEDPREGRAMIRTILQALLWEISFVTSAAYKETEVEEARAAVMAADAAPAPAGALLARRRWRA